MLSVYTGFRILTGLSEIIDERVECEIIVTAKHRRILGVSE